MEEKSIQTCPQADFDLSFWRDWNPDFDKYITDSVNERVALNASAEMVGHVAKARYFRLLACGREALIGKFSADELRLMLHAHPHQWWTEDLWGGTVWTVTDAIYLAYMTGDETTPEVEGLFLKIQSLNPMLRLALVDVLECAWRSNDPVDFALKALG